MRHPRCKHKGYRGPKATPWKYELQGRPVRRGKTYYASLTKDGVTLWSGAVIG